MMTDIAGTVGWEADYKPFGEATVKPNLWWIIIFGL